MPGIQTPEPSETCQKTQDLVISATRAVTNDFPNLQFDEAVVLSLDVFEDKAVTVLLAAIDTIEVEVEGETKWENVERYILSSTNDGGQNVSVQILQDAVTPYLMEMAPKDDPLTIQPVEIGETDE